MPSLQFKGKVFVQNHHLVVPYHELTPVKAKSLSKTASLHDNLIIEGDNLAALKALLSAYHGKVKCIYIDPPYNTGNEKWVYNDNVNSPMMQDWLGRVVDREDLTRHDKWCCMMMPRLKLLRELLRDDGAIFVSTDDNEVHHLRCLLDEIFGEGNFVAQFVWKKSYGGGSKSNYVVNTHEYVLLYARDFEHLQSFELPPNPETLKYYKFRDSRFAKRGPYRLQPLATTSMDERPNLRYAIPHEGDEIWPEKQWQWSKERTLKALAEDELVLKKVKGEWSVNYKQYLKDESGKTRASKPFSIIEVAYTQEGTEELRQILGSSVELTFPKPSQLIRYLIRIVADKESIVLDSFAGSGTTAHAVLELNKEDGGNRRFILVESEDYIDSITAERVRRVIRGVSKASDENLRKGLGGSFSYFKLGKALRLRAILEGSDLPDYESLASYVFFTATGEEFNAKKMKRGSWFIGESRRYDIFLMYEPDADKLKGLALTLDVARDLPSVSGKQKLVFAPTKYLDPYFLDSLRITFQQLPYQIYKALEA
jgi:adenine-specific DNA-methyltransferase